MGSVIGLALPAEASIIGADERVRVNPTTTFPYNNVVNLTVDGNSYCSGFMISRDTVATAAHCLYGISRLRIRVIPARNGNVQPFGSCTTTRAWIAPEYGSGNPEADYGYLKVNCGPYVVPAGLRLANLGSPAGLMISVAGYPDGGSTMMRASGAIQNVSGTRFGYWADTRPGQSGGPVLRLGTDNVWYVVGIHIEGQPWYGWSGNSATRLNPTVIARLQHGIATA